MLADSEPVRESHEPPIAPALVTSHGPLAEDGMHGATPRQAEQDGEEHATPPSPPRTIDTREERRTSQEPQPVSAEDESKVLEEPDMDASHTDSQQQLRDQEMTRLAWLSLPENDQTAYYSDSYEVDEEFGYEPGPSTSTNRNQKLRVQDGIRWVHRGKLGAWTEARTEYERQEREERRIHAFQHASVEALLDAEACIPGSAGRVLREPPRQRQRRGLTSKGRKGYSVSRYDENDLLGDDWDPEEDVSLSAATLAPSLLLPVLTPHDLLQSKPLKHIFTSPHIKALSRTAIDLHESEQNMKQALGRCFGAMERIFDSDERERNHTAVGSLSRPEPSATPPRRECPPESVQTETNAYESLKTEERGSIQQDDPQGAQNHYDHLPAPQPEDPAPSHSLGPMDPAPPLALINKLFFTKGGLTLPSTATSGDGKEGETTSVTLSEQEQRDIVYGSLENLNDLYSDSHEYMARLDETRTLLADVERHRRHVWNIVRSWAAKKDNMEYNTAKMYQNQGARGPRENFAQAQEKSRTTTATSSKPAREGEYHASASRNRKRRSGK